MLLFACLCLSAATLAQTTVRLSTEWYSPSQTTFVLSSPEELLGLSRLVAEGNDFKGKQIFIGKDIDLTDIKWQPVGTPAKPFRGTVDGGFNTITVGAVEAGDLGGLFGYVSSANIQNVTVSYASEISDCQIFGGVVAYSDAGTVISYCSHVGSLTVTSGRMVGGIAGQSDSYLSSCCNLGDVICTDDIPSVVAGVVATGSPTLDNCCNTARVFGKAVAAGLLGKASSSADKTTVLNSYNDGMIEVVCYQQTPAYQCVAAGLVGIANWLMMTSCWNTAKVNVSSYKDNVLSPVVSVHAAGLLGEGAGKIKSSFNVGDILVRNIISAQSSVGRVNNISGGLIGMNTEHGITEIDYCYNAGQIITDGIAPIKAALKYGGAVGDFASFMPKMTGVYSLEDCCQNPESGRMLVTATNNIIEKYVPKKEMTSAQFLQPQRTFITLNNENGYAFDIKQANNGFPVLRSVITSVPQKNENCEFILKGKSLLGGKRFFRYWMTGMERYTVDLDADKDFCYSLGKVAEGEHNVKAYVVLPDGTTVEGEKMTFTVY